MSKLRFPEVHAIANTGAHQPTAVFTDRRVNSSRIKFYCYPVVALRQLKRNGKMIKELSNVKRVVINEKTRHGELIGYNMAVEVQDAE